MPELGRLGDNANIPADSHGNPCCPHNATGPAVNGSPNVFINGKPALRVTDPGVHSSCCGSNQWKALAGSPTVKINDLLAHRKEDATEHCGGIGKLIEGSPDVIVGDAASAGAVAKASATPLADASPLGKTTKPKKAAPAKSSALPGDDEGPPWMKIAKGELGQHEIKGKGANSRILEYHASTTLKAKSDETAWCSSFTNWSMEQSGVKGTDSAAAASWKNWGEPTDARYGAVTVLHNSKAAGSSLTTSGNHVGFLVEETPTHYGLLGGNQSDSVKVTYFPKSKWKLEGYRWPPGQ